MSTKLVPSIDQSEILDVTKKLIKAQSVNPPGMEAEAAKIGAELMSKLGMTVEMYEVEPGRSNVIGRLKGSGEGPTLLFNGHLDVVPAGDLRQWSSPPFEPRVENSRIYGRGSCDMKGGLAAVLGAVRSVSDSKLRGDILVEMVMDEESGGRGTHDAVKRGYKADMAVIAEPTKLQVLTAHKGVVVFEISTHGKTAHASTVRSSGKDFGINAIYKMTKVISAFQQYLIELEEKKRHPLVGNATVNVGTIAGGLKQNVVPDLCTIVAERRLIPGEQREDAIQDVKAILDSIAKSDPEFKYDSKVIMTREPAEVSPEEKIVKLSREAVKSVTGADPGYAGFIASTDMAILVNQGGIPTVMLGPGDVAQAHTPNEFIEEKEIYAAARIYSNIILSALL